MTNKFRLKEIIEKDRIAFFPDIGTFFNNNIQIALDLIDQISASNLKVLKTEILHDPSVCLDTDYDERYYDIDTKTFKLERYKSLINRKCVSLSEYERIFDHARKHSMEIVPSVYDRAGADFALKHGSIAIKIASSNIINLTLIDYVSRLGLPVIIDTGHSSIEEIASAVSVCKENKNQDVYVLHSPPAPPAHVSQQNLRFMTTIGKSLGLPFGLSDHHFGEEMLIAAAALGASIVEKGVMPDNISVDQDVSHALSISELKEVYSKVRNVADALGTGVRNLSPNRQMYHSRPCLYAIRDIDIGEALSDKNVGTAFPLIGIPANHIYTVLDMKATKTILKGSAINWSDLK